MINAIDTHSHFNLSQFDGDRDEAIARMEAEGVQTICVGVDEETSAKAIELAAAHESIFAIVGQHPTEWFQEFNLDAFVSLAEQPKVVAIGECGLDYYREREREHKPEQEKLFRTQIELAAKMNLPLMLHIRPEAGTMDAYEDALAILKEYKQAYPNLIGTSHFFVGNTAIAEQFLDLGFYISFAGPITFAPEYEPVIAFVPLDRILSETDAPFAAPVPYRGKRAEPWHVKSVVQKIAEVKGLPLETVAQQLIQNAERLFKLQSLQA